MEVILRAWHPENKQFAPTMYWYLDPIGIPRWQKNDEVADVIVSMFTGIKDKNNIDIYSGDVIKVDNDDSINMWMRGETGEVKFIPSRFTLCLKNEDKKMLTADFENCVEIIGNIYENPELITI